MLGPWLPVPILPALLAVAIAVGWAGFSARHDAEARAALQAQAREARIEAANARAAAHAERLLRQTAEALERAAADRAEAQAKALEELRRAEAAARLEGENLRDEISELLSAPVAGDCAVDGALERRLRAR